MFHVSDVYWDPPCIIVMVQSENYGTKAFSVSIYRGKCPSLFHLIKMRPRSSMLIVMLDSSVPCPASMSPWLHHIVVPHSSGKHPPGVSPEPKQSWWGRLVLVRCEVFRKQSGVPDDAYYLRNCFDPTESLQVVTIRFPNCHLCLQLTKHYYERILSMIIRPVPLCEFGKCTEWCIKSHDWYLSRIKEFGCPRYTFIPCLIKAVVAAPP